MSNMKKYIVSLILSSQVFLGGIALGNPNEIASTHEVPAIAAISLGPILFSQTPSTQNEPAFIFANDSETKKTLWRLPMGFRSLFSIFPDPSGKYLAVISGAYGPANLLALPGLKNSHNTLYLLDGMTGRVILRAHPLADIPSIAWADEAWQGLNVEFRNGKLRVSGKIFVNPTHPAKQAFQKDIQIPKS